MRISFALTKEYEIFIDKEEIDEKYAGDTKEAIKDKLEDANMVTSYYDDIEIIDTDMEHQDVLYEKSLQGEYEAEKELLSSQYYRDLI